MQSKAGAAGMIENRQREMWATLLISLYEEIAAPHAIAPHWSRHTMFQLPLRM